MPVTNISASQSIPPIPDPVDPIAMVQAALELLRREIELFVLRHSPAWPLASTISIPNVAVPAIFPGVRSPDDEISMAYGASGKWMLNSDGEIANWGGLPYDGRTILEAVNPIIVDPTSTSAAQSAHKLDTAMFCSGFPAQPLHSTGVHGTIDDVTYG